MHLWLIERGHLTNFRIRQSGNIGAPTRLLFSVDVVLTCGQNRDEYWRSVTRAILGIIRWNPEPLGFHHCGIWFMSDVGAGLLCSFSPRSLHHLICESLLWAIEYASDWTGSRGRRIYMIDCHGAVSWS